MGDISLNFSFDEFRCSDGTPVPGIYEDNVRRLVEEVLQPLRTQLGHPIKIISGYRTPEYNVSVNGAHKSQHMVGKAADIHIDQIPATWVQQIMKGYMAARLEFTKNGGGVGWYRTFCHVDVRDSDRVAFWDKT